MPNIDRKLIHIIDMTTVGSINMYGEHTDGVTFKRIPCLIKGSKRRILNEKGNETAADYTVYFSVTSTVALNCKVANGYDARRNKILDAGTVISITDGIHPTQGRLYYEASIKRGV